MYDAGVLAGLEWKLDFADRERPTGRYQRRNRLSVLLPALHEAVQHPVERYRAGAGYGQDEHAARYGEILFEMV
ncbi:hypothetical protein X768_28045 [Mesorhizobium sp. LSJC265A00]|nr:hypothetical protein X768_28045 [Mesorhizobium sp. LSJC265A00]ESX15648.1 hypothetical protein X766_25650 [Mesorhizobium sp. LSJC255A00]